MGASAPNAPARLRNPWWIPPFLGRIPSGVEPSHVSLLGAVAFALIFEEYDLALITSVLPIIAELQVPIRYVGVGESVEDLLPFDARLFVSGLLEEDASSPAGTAP